MKRIHKKLRMVLCVGMSIAVIAGCGKKEQEVKLDAANPITINIWHYYNGPQKNMFDKLVEDFNETYGKERGIIVDSHNKGDVVQLEESVIAALNKEIGSDELPNIFASYADTAFAIEEKGQLADIGEYLSDEETAEYVESYIEEGRIGKENELKIFPIAKSTEVFMLNKTDWDKFAQETGASLDELATKEGVVRIAQKYYEWTDAKTPDIANDGLAFYGRDAMANLFLIGSMQLGTEIFQVENRELTLNLDQETMRRIWDVYYVPYIKGYFCTFGRFRSDDLKIGKIIAFTGSSTSATYFPTQVETESETYEIESLALREPVFEGGEDIAVQQGAGMVVLKSTPEEELASIEFLRWFTEKDRNLEFSAGSGYLPVKREACNPSELEKLSGNNDKIENSKALQLSYEIANTTKMYTNKAFYGGTAARKILEYHLADKAAADREEVIKRLEAGAGLEEATADFITDEAYENWYADFKIALEAAISSEGE